MEQTTKEEQEFYRAEQHWIVLVQPVLWAFASLIVFIRWDDLRLFGFVLAIFAVVTAVIATFTYASARFIITDQCVHLYSGLFRGRCVRLPLTEITGAHVERTLLGRILDYGLVIITDDKKQTSQLKKVAVPRRFVENLEQRVNAEEPVM